MAKQVTYDSSAITVLEGLEAVRERPGMYIGSLSTKGLNHLIYEIVDNSVDEHMAGFCDRINVTLEADGSATVSDNGRGIPVDMHEKGISAERLVFTTLHAGGKFNNNIYKNSGGLHGVGSSVVNALSKQMKGTIKRDGHIYEDFYEKGIPTLDLINGELPTVGRTKETGTSVNFTPDDTIFEKTRFKAEDINYLTATSISPTVDLTNRTVGEYNIILEFRNLDKNKVYQGENTVNFRQPIGSRERIIIYDENGPRHIPGIIVSPNEYNEAELVDAIPKMLARDNKQCAIIYTNTPRNSNRFLIIYSLLQYEEYPGVVILMCKGEE